MFPDTRSQAVKWLAVLAALLVIGLGWAGWREMPRWRSTGVVSVPMQAVGHASGQRLCPAAGSRLALRGDSHVAGARMEGPGGGLPYGAVLEEELGRGVAVAMHAEGGATAAMGEAALARQPSSQGLVLFAYGSNDAGVRGWLGRKTAVPLAEFRASLHRLIEAARLNGAQVALIAPPPPGSLAMAARLQPYREVVREVGQAAGVAVFDPAIAFAGCPEDEPLLTTDALHLNARGHACLGRWLARELCG